MEWAQTKQKWGYRCIYVIHTVQKFVKFYRVNWGIINYNNKVSFSQMGNVIFVKINCCDTNKFNEIDKNGIGSWKLKI